MALDLDKINVHKQRLQVGARDFVYAECTYDVVLALQTLADSVRTTQAEMDQLRRQLASTQAELGRLRGERDRFKEQLESSDRANAVVSLCTLLSCGLSNALHDSLRS
jgi:septal ring factor EnvC (AmiA/AmiB activator)